MIGMALTRVNLKPLTYLLALGAVISAAVALESRGGAAVLGTALAQRITPTYYTDVQPILEAHCSSCHIAGGIAPFELQSGADAVKWAARIAAVTKSGYMPPWTAGPESPAFLNDRRLGVATKQILSDWAAAGAPLGRRGANQKP